MVYQAVLKTQPDGKLASLAAGGSEPAFEAIVHRYRRPLLGYCRRLRLSDARSEDVVQQTFMNAWGSLRRGAEVRELRPWLYRITHNQAVSMLRSAGGDEASLDEMIYDSAGFGAGAEVGSTASVEVIYERQARLREALTAVAQLPELQREALLATAVDGLSYDEVAAALNTTGDAVRGLVYRARNSLRTGVAAVSPSPLVVWASTRGGTAVNVESIGQWLTQASIGGGSVGLSAGAIKGAAVIASSVAVVGGVGTGLEKQVFGSGTHHTTARASGHIATTASTGSTHTAAPRTPSARGGARGPSHGAVVTASVTPSRGAQQRPSEQGTPAARRASVARRPPATETAASATGTSTQPSTSSTTPASGQTGQTGQTGVPAAYPGAPAASEPVSDPLTPRSGSSATFPAIAPTDNQMQPNGGRPGSQNTGTTDYPALGGGQGFRGSTVGGTSTTPQT